MAVATSGSGTGRSSGSTGSLLVDGGGTTKTCERERVSPVEAAALGKNISLETATTMHNVIVRLSML